MLRILQKLSKTYKNSQKPAFICAHRRFHLKKQSQLSLYCVLRDAYCENEFEKTKPISERTIECKQFYRKALRQQCQLESPKNKANCKLNSVHWCWLMVNLKNKLVLSEVEWSQFSAGQEMA